LYIFKILEGYKGGGMSGFSIRFGEEKDLEALTNIYNYYVEHTTITFDIEIYTVERRKQWFEKYDKNGPYKLLVAENGGRVLGYATSSKLREKDAYMTSVETTIYVDKDARENGIGTRLYERLFEELKNEDVNMMYAAVTQPNQISENIHKKFGFKEVGYFSEVGRKFGKYWDVKWFERKL
jgi:phosphinothricin acetyltransferase